MMNDTEPRFYPTVIREMIRHENDVVNHRIMWLLIGQGLFANAYVSAGSDRANIVLVLAPVGVLMSLSAFAGVTTREAIFSSSATKPSEER